ncbi:pyruvate formate lyase family protein [Neobacillus sp. NPDC093127]|uniref:pyruvate formate lyase family protein n=1 Tax=Neobacillus sp. NPDC093127 TaxID=3364296 RepID=UPI003822034D
MKTWRDDLEQAVMFTETYRNYKNDHVAILEAMCLSVQYPYAFEPIQANDLIAGRFRRPWVRFTSHDCDELAFTFDEKRMIEAYENPDASKFEKQSIMELIKFWKTENTQAKVRAAYPPYLAEALPSDNWVGEPGIAFPLYRMCGVMPDFGKLLQLGIPELKAKVERHLQQAVREGGDVKLFEGMGLALDLFTGSCLYYADQAEQMSLGESDEARKLELEEIAAALRSITKDQPTTFREAIQLFWLYSLLSGVRNYGRMDVYFGDFLANDLKTNVLSEPQALKLVQSLWRLIASLKTVYESRVIIGGLGRRNQYNADRFAMLAMEASRTVFEIEPQLTLRCYTGMNPDLLEKALTVIGEGRTLPLLYNDDVNVEAAANAFRVSREEAETYVPFGCGEYILEHRSIGTPSGVINLLKALEAALHNGIDPMTGRRIGLSTGEPQEFTSFDILFDAYKQQIDYFTEIMADQEELEYRVIGGTAAYLYTSMLYDDCMERGKSLFDGGITYLGGTLETYGNINTADSLTAIRDLVFGKKQFSLEHLVQWLDADFQGFELERKELLKVPKYGNDDDLADEMAKKVHQHICTTISKQRSRTNLHSYLNVIINNSANTILGRYTSASADGRKAREPMTNGNTPSGGSDKNGMTALLNSIVKLDPRIHAGAVHNLKCSRELFTERREQFKAVLDTYFAKGGTQLMISVVNRAELEQAMIEPEKYSHVFVRVGGFSARFVELDRDVQEEILSRTLY